MTAEQIVEAIWKLFQPAVNNAFYPVNVKQTLEAWSAILPEADAAQFWIDQGGISGKSRAIVLIMPEALERAKSYCLQQARLVDIDAMSLIEQQESLVSIGSAVYALEKASCFRRGDGESVAEYLERFTAYTREVTARVTRMEEIIKRIESKL